MRKIANLLILALLTIGMGLTSCDEQLDNAVDPGVMPAVEEEVKVLGAALEAGATVTINYTVGGASYIATFQKGDGDTYTLISNVVKPATTRAMTRTAGADFSVPTGDAANATNILLTFEGGKLVFTVKSAKDATLFKALMNVADGAVTVINANTGGKDCTIGSVSVNDEVKEIKNPEMKYVNITSSDLKYPVKFSDGDTWANVVEIYKDIDIVKITSTTEGYISVEFSKDIVADMLKTISSAEDPEVYYNANFSGSFYLYAENSNLNSRAGTRAVEPTYTPIKSTDPVDVDKTYILGPAVPHELTSAVVGEIVGSDGKAYAASDEDRLTAIGVTAVAMVAYKSETVGSSLAIALKDVSENKLTWDNSGTNNGGKTAAEWCNGWNTSNSITGGTWQLPSKDQWNNMIQGLGGASSLQTKARLQAGKNYWSSTPHESNGNDAYRYDFGHKNFYQANRNSDDTYVRACLAF